MTLGKSEKQLLELLEKINDLHPQSPDDPEMEAFLILWRKVIRICTVLKKTSDSSTDQLNLVKGLLVKFAQQAKPKLIEFAKHVKKRPLGTLIVYFRERIQEYNDEAEQYIAILPMKSYEIYEDELFFINLHRFAFNPEIFRLAKKKIIQKIRLIKKAFEVEAGQDKLAEKEKQISEELSHSFKGPSPNVPQVPAGTQSSSPPEVSEDNLMIGELALPEEELYREPGETQTSAPLSIAEPLPGPSIPETTEEMQIPSISNIYPFHRWFPAQNVWEKYAFLRYCNLCGRMIDFSIQKCSGCHHAYSPLQ